MILLVTHGQPTMERFASPHLGRLVQPRHYSSVRKTAATGVPWAADNDAFNDGFDEEEFQKMLVVLDRLPDCLFIAAPDVLEDAEATCELFERWQPRIRGIGQPVALVLQDGVTIDDISWPAVDALFIGGSTDFKLGEVADDIATEGRARGKWIHMGRVNSLRRIRYAGAIGCDSVDGSQWARWTDTWIPRGIAACGAGRQGRLGQQFG